jgi:protein ImuB
MKGGFALMIPNQLIPNHRPTRFLSLYLPDLSIARLLRDTERLANQPREVLPIVLSLKKGNRLEVVRVSDYARRCGVYPQVSLPVAQTVCPELLAYKYDLIAEFSLLQKIALWCLTVSPIVGIDEEYLTSYLQGVVPHPLFVGILIDIQGTERIHHTEQQLTEKLVSTFAKRKIPLQIGIGGTIGRAWAHARFSGREVSIETDRSSGIESVSHYPIAALRLPSEIEDQIAELGIKTIAQLLRLPRKSLLKRFGHSVIERIEQLTGERMEFIRVVSPPPALSQRHIFEFPSNSSLQIAAAGEELYRAVCTTLEAEKKSPRTLSFSLYSERGHILWQRDIFFFRLTNPAEFRTLILSYLEKRGSMQDVGSVHLSVIESEKDIPITMRLDGSLAADTESALRGFIGTVTNKMGRTAVQQARLYDSSTPEESIGFTPIDPTTLRSPSPPYGISNDQIHTAPPPPYRPSLFFHPGHPVRVLALLPDHPPKRMYLHNTIITVATSIGPEKIEEPWFSEDVPSLRDYFRVCDTNGRWLWICHHRSEKKWTVCGVWVPYVMPNYRSPRTTPFCNQEVILRN